MSTQGVSEATKTLPWRPEEDPEPRREGDIIRRAGLGGRGGGDTLLAAPNELLRPSFIFMIQTIRLSSLHRKSLK